MTCPRFSKVIYRNGFVLNFSTATFKISFNICFNRSKWEPIGSVDWRRPRSSFVFVMTVGTNRWNKPKPKKNQLLLLTKLDNYPNHGLWMHFCLAKFGLFFFGDQQQLKEHCQSYTAKLAGLGKSVMFWLLFGYFKYNDFRADNISLHLYYDLYADNIKIIIWYYLQEFYCSMDHA